MKKLLMFFMVAISATLIAFGQDASKLSISTQIFLGKLNGTIQVDDESLRSAKAIGLKPVAGTFEAAEKDGQFVADPVVKDGQTFMSAFLRVEDESVVSELESLGVVIESRFLEGKLFTALIPVDKIEEVAAIAKVKRVNAAKLMRPSTNTARERTNVDDVLTYSDDAQSAGLPSSFDGSGVVLGVIDTGIDFNHIAFKDASGNSRIKQAYVYNGSSERTYTGSQITSTLTDDKTEDHGTHTSSTAGGSSVKVSGTTVTVTNDHSSATYGGMAPGTDLFLAGVNGLSDTYLSNALDAMCTYADNQGLPLVVSNSWGSQWGPHDGTGETADVYNEKFGDSHPNRVALFAASNDGGKSKDNEGGGYHVVGTASNSSPLGTICRSASYSNTDAGYYYYGPFFNAWSRSTSTSSLAVKIYVLDANTGAVKTSVTITPTSTQTSVSGLSSYYTGTLYVLKDYVDSEKTQLMLYTSGLTSRSSSTTTQNGSTYYKSNYTLAVQVYPTNGSCTIDAWGGNYGYFTNHLSTSGYSWTAGTDDGCYSDEATIANVISIGAYATKNGGMNTSYTIGDIADFSSWGTTSTSLTGEAYPWITAPGARLIAGVNHNHTASVDSYSYYGSTYSGDLVVNSSTNPYAYMEGTSMATPCAAGIVALWLQAANTDEGKQNYPNGLTVNDVKTIMKETAIHDSYTDTGANASHFGNGKIDALAGIQYILPQNKPKIIASPTSIDFGNVTAGGTATQTFNVQGTNLEGNISLAVSGTGYSINPSSVTATVAQNGTGATITVTFKPTANVSQTYNGTVTLTSSNASTVTVSLTGKGVYNAPSIAANPTSLSFTGNSGSTYTKTVTVTGSNLQGNITAAISDDANGFYSVSPTSFSGTSQTVTVTWAPTAGGTSTANLVLTTTGTGANTVTVPITGTAQGPTIAANPTSVTFNGYATQTYTQAVTVTGTNLSQNITASLTGADVYSIDKTSLTKTGGTITVTYAPTAAGNTNATLTLSSTGASTVTVPITGTAQAATPTLIVSPSALTYDVQVSESSSQTVTVSGRFLSEDVAVTLTDANNVFSVDKTTIDYTSLNNDATVTVTVAFNSANEGTFTGTLNLTSGNVSQSVALTGTANDTPTYINVLTNTLTAGNEYLIVSGNSAGSAYAMGHNATTVATDAVTIKSDASVADAVYIESDDVDATSVWTAGASGTLWTLKNGNYYATVSNSGGNRSLTFATSPSNNWTQGTNQLYYKGKNNYYYLRYYNNTFSVYTSANNIYIYEKTQVVRTPSLTVTPSYLEYIVEPGETLTQTFTVTGARLNENVTVTLTDANGVYTLDKSSISIAEATGGTTVNVTLNAPEQMGSYRGQVTFTSGTATATGYLYGTVGEKGSAYSNYLDIAQYSTIATGNWYSDYVDNPYKFTEDESNDCAWLTMPTYVGYVAYNLNDQTWTASNGYNNIYTLGSSMWSATDVFPGNSYYFTSEDNTARGVGMYSNTNTDLAFNYYNVTNCTQVKAYCYNYGVNTSYYPFIQINELIDNGDGTFTVSDTSTDFQSNTTSSGEITLTSTTLDESKIYRVYVGSERSVFYEVAFRTPLTTTTATLAQIEASGVKNQKYKVSDKLLAVYAAGDQGILWCKDLNNASNAPTYQTDGQYDYMRDIVGEQSVDWDQSNWVALQFSQPDSENGVKALVTGAVGSYIKAGTIVGTYSDANNYTITMAEDALQLENCDEEYVKNVYCTANFLPGNLNINGGLGALGRYHGEDAYYFFMNPKVQEVCEITYAQWDGTKFVVPDNDSQVDGAFTVDWSLNEEGPRTPTIDEAYRFTAVVNRTQNSSYLKGVTGEPSSDFVVCPLDFVGTGDQVITAINGIFTDGYREVVGVDYVNVAGMISDKPFQGVNIVVTRYSDGSKTTEKKVFK